MTDFTIEQLKAMREKIPPAPWEFQSWGYQNQNGDHSESLLLDGSGEIIILELPDRVGDAVAILPDLIDAHIAEKQAHQKLRAGVQELLHDLANDSASIGANMEEQIIFEERARVARDLAQLLEETSE